MATASDNTVATAPPPKGPAQGWAQRGGALSLAQKFLTLREGSIIVVTLIAFLYFALTSDRFLTGNSLKALLPYFAPFAIMAAGEVFVMINGEIDLSVGAVYLFTPFIFYKLNASVGLPLIPAMIGALLVVVPRRPLQRPGDRLHWHRFLHDHPGNVVHAGRAHADHLPRDPGDDAGHLGGQRGDVRADLRRRHLLGAVLGDRDHDRTAAAAVVLAMGDLHRLGGRQPARRRRGRCPDPERAHRQLRHVRAARRVRRHPRGSPILDDDARPVGVQRDPVPGRSRPRSSAARCSRAGRARSSERSSAPSSSGCCRTASSSRASAPTTSSSTWASPCSSRWPSTRTYRG